MGFNSSKDRRQEEASWLFKPGLGFILALAASGTIYLIWYWSALHNPWVIHDDVRQQIFWMQQWLDPELFRDDLLARYARHYVPWGVQAIYYPASFFINPVQFTKVVALVLWMATAGFLYGLGYGIGKEGTGLGAVLAMPWFATFARKIAGGLSGSFAFPLLAAYLYFLFRDRLLAAALVILALALLNPYICLLCLFTHALFLMIHRLWPLLRGWWRSEPDAAVQARRLLWLNLPLAGAVLLLVLKHLVFQVREFGPLVSWADMAGKVEYTTAGRYPLLPGPSLFCEVLRPLTFFFPFEALSPQAGSMAVLAVLVTVILGQIILRRRYGLRPLLPSNLNMKGLGVFGCLLVASLFLYFLADLFFMQLFLPRRYLEFSLNLTYCLMAGVLLGGALQKISRRGAAVFFVLLLLLGGMRVYHVGLYDYSRDTPLYAFFQTTPKNGLSAGHPEAMDNIMTFAGRRAFVTYELSHTWYLGYWETIKARTFAFFDAYYSEDAQKIRDFCTRNHISFLVVREEDFTPERLAGGKIYFEPFGGYIRELCQGKSYFALLDSREFPPLYQQGGIRVVSPGLVSGNSDCQR